MLEGGGPLGPGGAGIVFTIGGAGSSGRKGGEPTAPPCPAAPTPRASVPPPCPPPPRADAFALTSVVKIKTIESRVIFILDACIFQRVTIQCRDASGVPAHAMRGLPQSMRNCCISCRGKRHQETGRDAPRGKQGTPIREAFCRARLRCLISCSCRYPRGLELSPLPETMPRVMGSPVWCRRCGLADRSQWVTRPSLCRFDRLSNA